MKRKKQLSLVKNLNRKRLIINKKKKKYKNHNKTINKNIFASKLFNNRLINKIEIIFFLIVLFIIQAKIKKKKSNIKVAMCTIGKNENRYIEYFVEHYKKIGYNHIYLYDNNASRDESFSNVQIDKDGIKEGFITLINYKNIPNNPQMSAYYTCYNNYNSKYDWISFFDIDEYLILKPKNIKIQEFLDNTIYNNSDKIKFSWKVFTDNDQLEYQEGSPIERFPIETEYKYENRHTKSTVRGRLNNLILKRTYNPHSIWSNMKLIFW